MKFVWISICLVLFFVSFSSAAFVRFINAIPDAPAIDVTVDGKLVFQAVPFGQVTPYLNIADGESRNFTGTPTGTTTLPIFTTIQNLNPNTFYTLSAIGSMSAPQSLFFSDAFDTPVGNQAVIRVVDLSPNSPPANVLVNNNPLFTNVVFPTATSYQGVDTSSPFTFALQVNNQIVQSTSGFVLSPGGKYTIFILGLNGGSGFIAMHLAVASDITGVLIQPTVTGAVTTAAIPVSTTGPLPVSTTGPFIVPPIIPVFIPQSQTTSVTTSMIKSSAEITKFNAKTVCGLIILATSIHIFF